MRDWSRTKIKFVGNIIRGMSYNSDNVVNDGTLILRSGNIQDGHITLDDNVYIDLTVPREKRIMKNDILICACNGSSELVGKNAIVRDDIKNASFGAFMLVLRSSINCYLKYAIQVLFDMHRPDFFTTTICQIPLSNFNNYDFFLPGVDEQNKIADFLDKKIFAIDETIKKEEEAIKQLEDYRFTQITKFVLEGLSQAPLKETGVKWMPKIPSHWSYSKIGSNCYLKGRIGWQGLTADEYQDVGPYLITGTDFDNGGINWNTCVHITEKRYVEASHIRVRNGDVLITKDGTVGKVAIVENMPGKASLNSGVMLMRNLKGKYENKYLYYVLSSNVFWDWFYREKKENSTIVHLYQEQFEKFSFPLPPKNEQLEIAEYLDRKCKAVDELIKLKEQKIEKLKEYKKSLIYECVTGRREI